MTSEKAYLVTMGEWAFALLRLEWALGRLSKNYSLRQAASLVATVCPPRWSLAVGVGHIFIWTSGDGLGVCPPAARSTSESRR